MNLYNKKKRFYEHYKFLKFSKTSFKTYNVVIFPLATFDSSPCGCCIVNIFLHYILNILIDYKGNQNLKI